MTETDTGYKNVLIYTTKNIHSTLPKQHILERLNLYSSTHEVKNQFEFLCRKTKHLTFPECRKHPYALK